MSFGLNPLAAILSVCFPSPLQTLTWKKSKSRYISNTKKKTCKEALLVTSWLKIDKVQCYEVYLLYFYLLKGLQMEVEYSLTWVRISDQEAFANKSYYIYGPLPFWLTQSHEHFSTREYLISLVPCVTHQLLHPRWSNPFP